MSGKHSSNTQKTEVSCIRQVFFVFSFGQTGNYSAAVHILTSGDGGISKGMEATYVTAISRCKANYDVVLMLKVYYPDQTWKFSQFQRAF